MLNKLHDLLLVVLFITMFFLFFIKYQMFIVSKNLSKIDKEIQELENKKYLLNIELAYLTSTERILDLIERNPKLLRDKELLKVEQVWTEKQFKEFAMQKAIQNRQLAKIVRVEKKDLY